MKICDPYNWHPFLSGGFGAQCKHGTEGFCDRCPPLEQRMKSLIGQCVHGIFWTDSCNRCPSRHVQRNQSILPFIIHAAHLEAQFDEYDDSNPMIDAVIEAIRRPTLRSLSITETLYGEKPGSEWNIRKTYSPMALVINAFRNQSSIQSLSLRTVRKQAWSHGKSEEILALYKQSRWQTIKPEGISLPHFPCQSHLLPLFCGPMVT